MSVEAKDLTRADAIRAAQEWERAHVLRFLAASAEADDAMGRTGVAERVRSLAEQINRGDHEGA